MTSRSEIEFDSEGVNCRAWLHRPDGPEPPPVIVMAHGLGGVREMRLDAFAERFSEAGYACLVFDYRHFGASDGEPRQVLRVGRQLADWRAAIGTAQALDGVDGSRIVLWGTSFSGGHVLELAGTDGGVAAVVSQGAFTDGFASARAADVISSLRVAPRVIADLIAERLGRPPVTVPITGPPRSAAMITSPDGHSGYQSIIPDGSSFENRLAARLAADIATYSPGKRAADISCPVLLCVCDQDSVAPADVAVRHVSKAPAATIRRYPIGHFDIYVGDGFETAVADQIAFLHDTVPPVVD